MNKQEEIYICTSKEIWFGLKKEGNSDTCYNMKEASGHCVEWNKPVRKEYVLYNSTYMRYLDSSFSG